MRVFEVEVGGQKLTLYVEGLEPTQRCWTKSGVILNHPAVNEAIDWTIANFEPNNEGRYPARDLYAEYLAWCTLESKPKMSANRLTRTLIKLYGPMIRVRHPITGQSVPGIMAKRRIMA